jgi:two-component system invasion response regulator UvrY
MIQVMLVDDHAIVRMGFRLLLEATPDIRVAAEAGSGEAACEALRETTVDVVVIDLSMPGIGGITAVERLRVRHPGLHVLVLSAHEDPIHVRRALAAGALGYLSKRTAPEALAQAIRQVARGTAYLDRELATDLALGAVRGRTDPVETLSTREFEVFLQLARGRGVAQIAQVLCVSPSTIGTHLYHVKQKLGASNAAELAMIAMRAGLIEA